jgi:hypothetical protein
VKILVRESCVEVVKIEFLLQKVEISVRASCVEVHKFARLTPTPNTERAAPPLKGPPLFLKIYDITLRQDKKFFFASQDKECF